MASKEVVKQLRRLSKREWEILQLRCDALEIAECCRQLNLSGGTVKTYIGRIYLKFDIDQLQELQRWKALFQIYCPVLKEIDLLPARDEPEDPSPIPPLLMQRVEDDEEFLYNLKKANLLSLLEEPAQPPQRSTRW